MGFLSRLFGGGNDDERDAAPRRRGGRANLSLDEQAVDRYRYLLQTAPPETIEQAHADAFERLTPEQRQMVLQELGNAVPENERATSDDPRAMARMATRAEMRQPGTMERTFSGIGGGGGIGMGGLMAGSFFSSFAGIMVGGAIANAFFNDSGYNDGGGDSGDSGDSGDGGDSADGGDSGADGGDAGFDSGGDFGGGEF